MSVLDRGLPLVRVRLRGGPGTWTLARTELRLFRREPLALFWGVVFPLILLLVIGLATGNKHQKIYGGLRFIDVYTPVLLVFVFGIVGLQAMPGTLVGYREKGYLRRLSTTPVGAGRLIQAQWLIYTALSLTGAIVTTLVATVAFSVHLPTQFVGFLLILLLTAMAMLSIGTLIASLAPNPRVGQLIGGLSFYPMMFFAGLWVPQASMGPTLRDIGHCTPLGAAVDGLGYTMAGQWPPAWCFLCLIAWAVIVGRLAVRLFRWE